MLSLVKYVAQKSLKWRFEKELAPEINGVDSIASQLQESSIDFNNSLNHQKISQDETVGTFYKRGEVTCIGPNYLVIENKYQIEKDESLDHIRLGDVVMYVAFKKNKDDDIKIHKIKSVVPLEGRWKQEQQEDSDNEDEVLERRKIGKRKFCVKVTKRAALGPKRIIYCQPGDISFDLNDGIIDFLPYIGDYLDCECLTEMDDENPYQIGDCLEVVKVRASNYRKDLGEVTFYDDSQGVGNINDTVIFVKSVCQMGYIPRVKDVVVFECIESEQSGFQYRALQIIPLLELKKKNDPDIEIGGNVLSERVETKEMLEVETETLIMLNYGETKEFEVMIKNIGTKNRHLKKCITKTKPENSQLELLSPRKNDSTSLHPGASVIYTFRCTGKYVGVSKDQIIFKFKDFEIYRIIDIQVAGDALNDAIDNKNRNLSLVPTIYEEGMYVPGQKPFVLPKFIASKTQHYRVPKELLDMLYDIRARKIQPADAYQIIVGKIKCLTKPLSYLNYCDRFHNLLYMEQVANVMHIENYKMWNVYMQKKGEFLVLNVPGLPEKKPSLIVGDRAIIKFPWDNTQGEKAWEGCIHKTQGADIYLKFDVQFHEVYHKEECNVEFKTSSTVIQRCHNAIKTALLNLGEDILFPTHVGRNKEPQYNFVEEDEETLNPINCISDTYLKKLEKVFKERKVIWLNKDLNIFQKTAVKNILKGLARPLPYVLFGPPGTGKTVTLVEAILQVAITMSESRILIATPSNSSANLITERLIEYNKLIPGDLVRIVAWSYLDSSNISEKILPFCATAEISSEGSKSNVNVRDSRGMLLNATLSTLGRHKITVGTCTALGILHNMGYSKNHFTHVFIDEAGQATEPEAMIPLSLVNSRTGQIILAGDPQQLGPVIMSRYANYFGLGESFLDRIIQQFPYHKDIEGFPNSGGYDPRLVTKLLYNYRSLPEILELPNKLFYDSELESMISPSESPEAELLRNLSDVLPKRIGDPPAIVFQGVEGKNLQDPDSPSWYNMEEIYQISKELQRLYYSGLGADDIGIITPYDKQVRKTRDNLRESELELPKIGSVEEFQGQERKVIILSTVRSRSHVARDDVEHALGFVAAPKRLNVAISRARALLIIIGNPYLLRQDTYWRSVIRHCINIGSYCGCPFELDGKKNKFNKNEEIDALIFSND